MHRCTRAVVCALALFVMSAAAAPAQMISIGPAERPTMQAPDRVVKTGTGRLRGRVISADTGTVLRRAQVTISNPDIGGKTAVTDAQGRYEFRDLPAGRFSLSASKSGFLEMKYGQSRPSERGRRIELADGQALEKVDIVLPRGGAISGRILDEFGDPIPDASVAAMRVEYATGKPRLTSAGRPSMTNDLGYFRLFGLSSGEYYVTASARGNEPMGMEHVAPGVSASNNTGYATTYYPGTPNQAEAQRIALAVGQEVSVDVQMSPVRLARIVGRAVSSDGKPISRAMVMLVPVVIENMGMMGGGTETDTDGAFTLGGVPPGEYIVHVQSLAALMTAAVDAMGAFSLEAPPPTALPTTLPPANREFAIAKVSVSGEDITGLTITGARGARASGQVIFEHGEKPEPLTSLRLMAETRDHETVHFESVPPLSALKENGSFEIEGLMGRRVFGLMNPPKGWFLKGVTHEGEDVTDTGYEFTPGEDVKGFEIILTTRSQAVTGVVANDNGEPVLDYTVIVFPQDENKWTQSGSRWYGSSEGDQQGQFRVSELPPGSYFAIAVEADSVNDWMNPEWFRAAAKTATKFTLDEGATKRLELKLARP